MILELFRLKKISSLAFLFLLPVFGWGCADQYMVKVSTSHRGFSIRGLAGKKVLILPFYNTSDTGSTTLEHIIKNICKAKFHRTKWVTEKSLEDDRKELEETLIKIEPYKQLDLFISEFRNTGRINKSDFAHAFPENIGFVLAVSLESVKPTAASNEDYLFKGKLQFWRVDRKEIVFDCFFEDKVTYDNFEDYSNSFSEAKIIVYRQVFYQALNKIPRKPPKYELF